MKAYGQLIAITLAAGSLLLSSPQTTSEKPPLDKQGSLQLGLVQNGTLAPDTGHLWQLDLERGEFARVEVYPIGIAVKLRSVDPKGQVAAEFDQPSTDTQIDAVWLATADGTWGIEVLPADAIEPGHYEILWSERKTATPREDRIVEARQLGQSARRFLARGQFDESEALFKQLLPLQENLYGQQSAELAATLYSLAELSRTRGNLEESERLYQAALAIREELFGANHHGVAESLNGLANLYSDQGRYAEAMDLATRALRIAEETVGEEDPRVAAVLTTLGSLYWAQGQVEEAEPYLARALEIRRAELQPNHPSLAESLSNLATLRQYQGKYEGTETLYQQAISILEKAHGRDHPDYATALGNLADLYSRQGRYNEAEPLLLQTLQIRERALGSKHPDVGLSLHNMAGTYHLLGRFSEAQELFERALGIWEEVYGREHPYVATTLDNLASVHQDQGHYSQAETLHRRALAIREATLEPDHPQLARSLNNLANLYYIQGRFSECEPLWERARTILENSLGTEHVMLAVNLNNLASLYHTQGLYTRAEPLYLRALAIQERATGPEHRDVAISLNNLATLYADQARYAEAELCLQRALEISEKALGAEHPLVATNLANLATLYRRQRRYSDAEPRHVRALEIRRNAFGAEHRDVAASLSEIGLLFEEQERFREAEPLYRQALSIGEKLLGSNHPDNSRTLHQLADLYRKQGKYTEAEPLLQRSLTIRQSTFGPEHPEVAYALLALARLFNDAGTKGASEILALLDRAIAILDQNPAHPEWRAEAYSLRSRLRWQDGRREEALSDLSEALRTAEELRPQVGGGEETRAAFFEKYADDFDRMVDWLIEQNDVADAIEYADRGRARVLLDQLAAGKIDLRESIPAETRAALEEREGRAKARLAEFQQRITLLRSRTDLEDEARIEQIRLLEADLQAAQTEFQQIYEEIKNASPLWHDLITSGGQPVALPTIQRRLLSPQSALFLYQIGRDGSFLFLVPPVGEEPTVFPLRLTGETAAKLGLQEGPFKRSDLRRLLLGQESGRISSRLIQRLSDLPALSHLLWKILVPSQAWGRCRELEELIIVPDGLLHLIPFDSLVVRAPAEGEPIQYWLDEGPAIRYAASATTLYNIERRPKARITAGPETASALSLSDPVYNPSEVASARDRGPTLRTAPEAEKPAPTWPGIPGPPPARNRYERAGGVLRRLPGTARETEAIEKAVGQRSLLSLQDLTATEPQLRSSLQGRQYIHLATHGLISQDSRALFSALALTPPPDLVQDASNDGFLELHEIYGLSLGECELAVLSACETNVGQEVRGEGIFALSRGFLAAGARRVVASQWAVDDDSTAELIGEFFRHVREQELSGGSINYALALREAKRLVRSRPQWSDPYYWAAFVLTGKR